MVSYFFLSSSLDFDLLSPNSISHFHPSLIVCLSLNLLHHLKLLTWTTIPKVLILISAIPDISRIFLFFSQISLSFQLRGTAAGEAQCVHGGEAPTPSQETQAAATGQSGSAHAAVVETYADGSCSIGIHQSRCQECARGDFSKACIFAKFRQFLSGIVKGSSLTELDLTSFSAHVPRLRFSY